MQHPYAQRAVYTLGAFAFFLAYKGWLAHEAGRAPWPGLSVAFFVALCAWLVRRWPDKTGWIAPVCMLAHAAFVTYGLGALHATPESVEAPALYVLAALSLLALAYTRRRGVALCSTVVLCSLALLTVIELAVPREWYDDGEHAARVEQLQQTFEQAIATAPLRRAQTIVALPAVEHADRIEPREVDVLALGGAWLELNGKLIESLDALRSEPTDRPLYLALDRQLRIARLREVLASFPKRPLYLLTAAAGDSLAGAPPPGASEFARAWRGTSDRSAQARLLSHELSMRSVLCPSMRAPLAAWRKDTARDGSTLTRVIVDGLRGCPGANVDMDALAYVVLLPLAADLPLPNVLAFALPAGHDASTLQQLLDGR